MSARKPPSKSGGKRPNDNQPKSDQHSSTGPNAGLKVTGNEQPKVRYADEQPAKEVKPAGASNPRNGSRPLSSTTVRRKSAAPPPPPKGSNLPIFIMGGILLVAIGVFVAVLALGSKPADVTPTAANVTPAPNDIAVGPDPTAQVQTFADQGNYHLDKSKGETAQTIIGKPYNSNPPTSGPHLPTWSNWGVFNQPLSDELQIHNLEHGGIVIQYDCPQGCSTAINALSAYARRYQPQNFTGILLAPRAGGLPDGARIALTSWTHRLLLKSLDTDKIGQFVSAYIGKGPERDPNFQP